MVNKIQFLRVFLGLLSNRLVVKQEEVTEIDTTITIVTAAVVEAVVTITISK